MILKDLSPRELCHWRT